MVTELPPVTFVGLATNLAEADLALIAATVVVPVSELADSGAEAARSGVPFETFTVLGPPGQQQGTPIALNSAVQPAHVDYETIFHHETVTPADRYRIGLEESFHRLLQQRQTELQEEPIDNRDRGPTPAEPMPMAPMDISPDNGNNPVEGEATTLRGPGDQAAPPNALLADVEGRGATTGALPRPEHSSSRLGLLTGAASLLVLLRGPRTEKSPLPRRNSSNGS